MVDPLDITRTISENSTEISYLLNWGRSERSVSTDFVDITVKAKTIGAGIHAALDDGRHQPSVLTSNVYSIGDLLILQHE